MEKINKILNIIQIYISIIVGFIIGELGGITPTLSLLFKLIVIDVITGIIKGLVNHDLNSRALFNGGYKKCLIMIVIIISNQIDLTFTDTHLREGVIVYYIINEFTSILENISVYIDLPETMKKYFSDMQEKEDVK